MLESPQNEVAAPPPARAVAGDERRDAPAEGLSIALQVLTVLLLVGCTYNLRSIRSLLPEDRQVVEATLPQDALQTMPAGASPGPTAPSPGAEGGLHAGSGHLNARNGARNGPQDGFNDLLLHDIIRGLIELRTHAPAEMQLSNQQMEKLRLLEPGIHEKLNANDRSRFDGHSQVVAALSPAQLTAIREMRRKGQLTLPGELRELLPAFHQIINGGG